MGRRVRKLTHEWIAQLRKSASFAGWPRGDETVAILGNLTSICRRHDIRPQRYFKQLLANLPDMPVSEFENCRPDC